MKRENGITLIALVVTIIILLILAGVSLNGLLGNNGIIKKSQEVTRKYENTAINELEQMNKMNDYLNNWKNDDKDTNMKTDPSGKVPIPEELYYVGGTIEDGVVVSDNPADENKGTTHEVAQTLIGNQFVWIPVPDISIMYNENTKEGKLYNYDFDIYYNDGYRDYSLMDGIKFWYIKNKNINPDYTIEMAEADKMGYIKYIFKKIMPDYTTEMIESMIAETISESGLSENEWLNVSVSEDPFYPEICRVYEPKTLPEDSIQYDSGITQEILQDEFDAMISSVKKYKGFYIGRYETGDLTKQKACIKANNVDMNTVNWYTAYSKIKDMYKSDSGVKASIIWGCEWDAMLQYFKGKSEINEMIKKGLPEDHYHPTGSLEKTKIYNIYDIYGARGNMTMENTGNSTRTRRNGKVRDSDSYFAHIQDYFSFRTQLYIK